MSHIARHYLFYSKFYHDTSLYPFVEGVQNRDDFRRCAKQFFPLLNDVKDSDWWIVRDNVKRRWIIEFIVTPYFFPEQEYQLLMFVVTDDIAALVYADYLEEHGRTEMAFVWRLRSNIRKAIKYNRRLPFRAWTETGYAILDNRRILLGEY